MELIKKQVWIELRTVIEDEDNKELSILKHPGDYRRKGDVEFMTFTDEMAEIGEVEYYITIYPHKVNIKRSGSIGMNQQFIVGKKTETLYRHPYGAFHMEIFTESIDYQALEKNLEGCVTIQYEALLNGEQTRQHHLTLVYTEAKSV